MSDRGPYGNGRVSARREADRSQPSLLIGVGFFVVALLVIGAILFSGRGNDGSNDPRGVAVSQVSSTATTTSASILPGSTSTGIPTSTTGLNTVTSTSTSDAPTATVSIADPTTTSGGEEKADETPVPTDVPTEVIEPEPTEVPDTAVVEPTDTEAPSVGDFGTLPPAQIVSGGLSRSLDLGFKLATSLSDAPSSAPVYQIEWPNWTEDDVASIAANLGLEGAVEGGPGNYQVFGATGQIYFNGPTIQYVNTGSLPDLPLGDDASVIQTASAWMYANGFISDDLDGGAVIGRDEGAGRAVVLFKPAQVSPVLSFVPSATVTVGPGGSIVEANIRWPVDYVTSEYGLRPADALWNKVLAGEGSVEADLSGVSGTGALSGTMTVSDISIAYSYAGSPGGGEFLVPLIVFSGEATLNETGDIVPVSIYLAAVAGQASPQG